LRPNLFDLTVKKIIRGLFLNGQHYIQEFRVFIFSLWIFVFGKFISLGQFVRKRQELTFFGREYCHLADILS
jgi:hypothetical protein